MNRVAKFEKVTYKQFEADYNERSGAPVSEPLENVYDDIILPVRATVGSAGYDFFAPFDICLKPGESMLVPTGIRAKMDDGWVLLIFPRSGLGFKFRLQLNNTVGVIDSDYYDAANEGHIMCRITNDTNEGKTLYVKKGDGFAQGIFMMYGITCDDDADKKRVGGFGSTTKN